MKDCIKNGLIFEACYIERHNYTNRRMDYELDG
jgi:hypothetical protein